MNDVMVPDLFSRVRAHQQCAPLSKIIVAPHLRRHPERSCSLGAADDLSFRHILDTCKNSCTIQAQVSDDGFL
jgi:hypothetical protein